MKHDLKSLTMLLATAMILTACSNGDRGPAQNPSGELDTSFGTAGIVTTSIGTVTASGGSSFDYAHKVAIQSDGKIVAVGSSDNTLDFALARYNADGTLDLTFGTGGKVMTSIGMWDDAFSAVIQPDGKIIAVGSTSVDSFSYTDFALVRYNVDGSLDSGFGSGGKVITAVAPDYHDFARCVALQSDGKILVAGTAYTEFALARYNADGTLDTTFGGGDGKVITPVGSGNDVANSIIIQSDGKIVLAGNANDGSLIVLTRYDTDGALDASFGTGGFVITDIGTTHNEAQSAAIQSDGKIVVAGFSNSGADYDFALARYNSDGSLDTTFDSDGKVTTAIGTGHDFAYSVAIQSDGKIIAAGATSGDFAVARYNANGSLDTSFDTDGIITTSIGASGDTGYSVALDAAGKIIVAGSTYNGSDYDFALVRYWQ